MEIWLSIITPVYNGEKYILDCLKNVAEEYLPGIEHLIMDGGSTDQTMAIVADFAKENPYITYVSAKDKGQSDAMNKGIQLSKGKLISFLNVDDYYEKNALKSVQNIYPTLNSNSFLVGNCQVWDQWGRKSMVNRPIPFTQVSFSLDYNFPFNPSAYFYHKSLHDLVGLYDVNEHFLMDIDFILKILPVAKVIYKNEIWGNYRQVEGSKTIEDIKAGRNIQKLEALFKRYESRLSPIDKATLFMQRRLGNHRGLVNHYLDNPGLFWDYVWKKMRGR